MSVIRCDVVAKNKVLFSGELYDVMVPGIEGELGIMENHEPFVTALADGVIWARTQQEGGRRRLLIPLRQVSPLVPFLRVNCAGVRCSLRQRRKKGITSNGFFHDSSRRDPN